MSKNHTTVYKGVAILSVILCHAMGTFGRGITLFTPLGGIGVVTARQNRQNGAPSEQKLYT